MKFSDMREYVETADVPFLLVTTQQVHKSIDAWTYHGKRVEKWTDSNKHLKSYPTNLI